MEERVFGSASDFLSALRLSRSELWGRQLTARWIFRGHADASWKLLPSAFREAGIQELQTFSRRFAGLINANLDRAREELIRRQGTNLRPENVLSDAVFRNAVDIWMGFRIMLCEFGRHASQHGHLPWEPRFGLNNFDVPYEFKNHFSNAFGIDPDELVVAAQHYGLPTFLLDWTYDPMAAAFFASDPTPAVINADLAVWAIDTYFDPNRELDNRNFVWIWYGDPARNERLRSQKSVFTIDGFAYDLYLKTGSFEDIAARYADTSFGQRVRKFVISGAHRLELAQLLWKEGVCHAALFPELASCARDVRLLSTIFEKR